jgi:hypothetical protein
MAFGETFLLFLRRGRTPDWLNAFTTLESVVEFVFGDGFVCFELNVVLSNYSNGVEVVSYVSLTWLVFQSSNDRCQIAECYPSRLHR